MALADSPPANAVLVLASNVVEGTDEEAFNRWYREIHVPDILTIPEVLSCQRYRTSAVRLMPSVLMEPAYEYFAIYTLEGLTDEAMQTIIDRMDELAKEGISYSHDF